MHVCAQPLGQSTRWQEPSWASPSLSEAPSQLRGLSVESASGVFVTGAAD